MEFVKKSINKWIEAALILTIGILIVVAGAQLGNATINWSTGTVTDVSADALNAISLVLGIAFIVIGSLVIIAALAASILNRKGFAAAASGAGMTLAIGIWLVAARTAAQMLMLLLGFVPYALIVVGSVMLVDAVFVLVNGIREKAVKKAIPAAIVGFVVSIASIVLGALCLAKNGEGDTIISQGAQLIIFGVILIVYAAYLILATFVPTVEVVVVKTVGKETEEKKAENTIDASATEEKKEN